MLTAEQLMRRGQYPRRRLLHVLGDNRISSMTMFCLELIQHMSDYSHTVICQADVANINKSWMWTLQATGAELLHSDWRTQGSTKCIITEPYAAVVMYDTWMFLSSNIPKIYYQYEERVDEECVAALLGPQAAIRLPPAIRSRTFRNVKRDQSNKKFTVAVLSSGREDRYPITLLRYFVQHMPPDIRLVVSDPGKIQLDHLGRDVWQIPVMVDAPLKGLQMADVAVYSREKGYCTPYGRLCAEMLASGVPVVCEKRGAPVELYKEGEHVLFFDTPEQALERVLTLQNDQALRETLGANGKLIGSLQDITTHLGTLRDVLRSIGA